MQSRTIAPEKTPERERYYQRLHQYGLAPLWERLNILLTPEPQVRSTACLWDYDLTRNLLLESATVISAHEAERRVLILDNPGLNGSSAITETLYAGWQLVMPGEIAPAHRHSPSALRFILEGDGRAYTSVNGEKAYMSPGDLILTPSGEWHDHGNEGGAPVVWLDVLDLPLIRNIGSIFLDLYPEDQYPNSAPPGASRARFGAGMMPVNRSVSSPNSPTFHYPYETARKALVETAHSMKADEAYGIRLEYVNPLTGGPALATISTFLQWMPSGYSSQRYRTTEGMVFSVVEGRGSLVIRAGDAEVRFDWKPRDAFVIPCWAEHEWNVSDEAILFAASDRGIQQRSGIWREQRVKA